MFFDRIGGEVEAYRADAVEGKMKVMVLCDEGNELGRVVRLGRHFQEQQTV